MVMDFKDYYQTLGVSKTAAADEIKKAYRKKARQYHPDVSKEKDTEARMKEINEANAVLSDPEKRAAYDRLGTQHKSGEDFQPPPDWDVGFEYSGQGANSSDFSEFFASLFKQSAGAGSRQMAGQDHHAKIMVDLNDAYDGSTRSITLQASELDTQGHWVVKERKLNVRIPKGVKENQMIRLSGQGTPGFSGGKPGDLYLQVYFKPHPNYRIDGSDVYETIPIAPWEAALGASIKVPTPDGVVEVKVPAGSKTGQKLRLKGRGIPGNQSLAIAGDLYIQLEIVLPPANSDHARKLYETMAQQLAFNPRQYLGL